MATDLDMAVDLDARLRSVDEEYLRNILDQVNALTSPDKRRNAAREDLQGLTRQVLDLVTQPELLAHLRDRLDAITNGSHDDMIAVANPSVRRLERRVEIPELLDESPGYPSYKIGDLVLDENPYFTVDAAVISDDQIKAAKVGTKHGGPFRGFDSDNTWTKDDDVFHHIPHPDEDFTNFQHSWYMVTGRTPASLPDPINTTNDPNHPAVDPSKVRNVVKTVEVEYGDPNNLLDTGDVIGSTTVTNPDGTTTTVPVTKKKAPHIFIMYAGGNGT